MSSQRSNYATLSVCREAKELLINNFKNLLNLNESILNLTKPLTYYNNNISFLGEFENVIVSTQDKCSRIISVLKRKQMKCAFFGRTSNGKSSVINSILGQKILPYGIGHTTNCFVQIQGTPKCEGYMVKSANTSTGDGCAMDDCTQNENLPINSVHDLSHALSNDKVSSESLIYLYWPYQNCEILKTEVSLLDSPGIDIDPDLDSWINHYCLDADVFVLVANAESTLTQTEKSFFHKVKEKLSTPNILILNNKWDACDTEEDYVAAARKQHEQRCVDFLSKELRIYTETEAMDRVFFVSAKEMLECRAAENAMKNNNCKMLDRYESFIQFEHILEIDLVASALKTKFSSHTIQGLEIMEVMLSIVNNICAKLSANLKEANEKKLEHTQVNKKIKSGIPDINDMVNKQISLVLDNVIAKVVSSLQMEIKYLHYIVKKFESPFDPDPAHLLVYKSELNNFIEVEINKRISSVCSSAVKMEMLQFKKFLINVYNRLLGYEIDKSFIDIVERTNEHELTIPCNSLFSNFKEDLSFRWPLSPHSLLKNALVLSKKSRNHIDMDSPESSGQVFTKRFDAFRPVASQIYGLFVTREFIGFCLLSVAISRVTGFRVYASSILSYGCLYILERFRWSRNRQESNFKNQYVKYASNQLTSLIDVCTRSYGCVIKQDLYMSHKSVSNFVDNELARYDAAINKYKSEIGELAEYLNTAELLKSDATMIQNNLLQFKESYL